MRNKHNMGASGELLSKGRSLRLPPMAHSCAGFLNRFRVIDLCLVLHSGFSFMTSQSLFSLLMHMQSGFCLYFVLHLCNNKHSSQYCHSFGGFVSHFIRQQIKVFFLIFNAYMQVMAENTKYPQSSSSILLSSSYSISHYEVQVPIYQYSIFPIPNHKLIAHI